jgi:kynureninase
MAHTLASLAGPSNSLAPHYSRFRVAERLLLTGHSHQAWPDVAAAAHAEAFDDAARLVDDKWGRAFEKAARVRAGFQRLLDDPDGAIALCPSTHDAVVRFLSALPLRARPHLLTTDSEFHTLRRQLGRLAEEGLEVTRVAAAPAATLVPRLIDALGPRAARTAAVLVSTVSFVSGQLVPGLGALQAACDRAGVALLLDAYHQLGVAPFSIARDGLDGAFVTGGGYKYCQLGEGNCFLRLPPGCALRPIVTGWFAEFGRLDAPERPGATPYAEGADRFAGATYDPVSHYRAAAVFDFFAAQGLDAPLLRAVSQAQIAHLCDGFDRLGLDPALIDRDRSVPLAAIAGFLALRAPRAAAIVAGLRRAGVLADARADLLRLGPAPYLTNGQLDGALAALAEVAGGIGR